MKVFAGFIRKYYQSFFSFISKSISPIFAPLVQVEMLSTENLILNQNFVGQNYFNQEEKDDLLVISSEIF